CHNDLGLATANTLAAIAAGASQAEVSVSGIGERAGNAALEEVYANLAYANPEARGEGPGAVTGIRRENIGPLIDLAAGITGYGGSPLKPLSGWNARAHGSGIHQQGLSRRRETYSLPLLEEMNLRPERIVLSRHSGREGLRLFARRYCRIDLSPEQLARAAALVKGTPGAATGISEFIAILAEMKALPPEYPGPLVIRDFSETLSGEGWPPGLTKFRVRLSLGPYGKDAAEERRQLTGEGPEESAAIAAALSALPGPALSVVKTALSGSGGRFRLYAEIAAGGRLYPVERTGAIPGRLLCECCLDAVNGEGLRYRINT
ncbi:MAG: 2-isopropylmalate synthase, partial [Treponema sp.]|nr:2-isopropylmalate synthase [Treponema sp.]